jgi:transcription elongation factor Elf1
MMLGGPRINSQPIPFTCSACGTEYKIVTIALRDVQQSRISCLNCDALFPAGEGHVAFEYFVVRRQKRNEKLF